MPSLVIEDGTIVAGADSYISAANAVVYGAKHTGAGQAAFAALAEASQESALRISTQWLDARYQWPGTIVDDDQALSWPRAGAIDSEGRDIASDAIPQAIKDALCEAAFAHALEDLNEIRSRGGLTTSETVGPISVTYSSAAPPGRSFPFIDSLLKRIAGPFMAGILTLVR